ncbi:hypothetical protein HELRODRAFT_98251 [Helobdella robusta]|uniref:Innexin n=1 Tax=Helobdella robusta TaxID=6412 RepID=T1G9L4_HELRO|nr:hypothetical protein HELRODRAFT_98251 [Helobdella robusta]ESO08133.1 hypothetical protein HELRODRAFT_98251 [Helobdella robusta]
MDRILFLFRDAKDVNLGGADSFSDRLSCQYTVTILIIFAIMTTTRQYVSEPISCWCPNYFTRDQIDYVNKVCWTTSTYYLSEEIAEIPDEKDIGNMVSYYQWIPLMAVGQAAMFFMPRIIWNLLNKKSGISVSSITDAAVERQKKADQCSAEKTMEFMVKSLGKFLKELSWDRTKDVGKSGHKVYGNYLTCLYILIKLIYIINVILQIFLLNGFLKTNYELYGFETIRKMLAGQDWTTSERFPRISMCSFTIRAMGENMHKYLVQCAIPINLLHEIFYIFLWFWFVFLLVVTSYSTVSWCHLCFPLSKRETYVRNKLYADGILRRKPDPETEIILAGFVKCYLRRDGCFIARLVGRNTSDVVAAELLGGLWKDYRLKTIKFKSINNNDDDDLNFVGDRYAIDINSNNNNNNNRGNTNANHNNSSNIFSGDTKTKRDKNQETGERGREREREGRAHGSRGGAISQAPTLYHRNYSNPLEHMHFDDT